MKVLHVTPNFYPATAWGGPIHSTKAICDGIHDTQAIQIKVLTTDAASPAIRDRVAPADLPYPVSYAARLAGHSTSPGLLARLPSAVQWADIVHLTGTYNFPSLPTLAIARALGKPVVWSPRGALQATQSWADAPRKRAKTAFTTVANWLRPADTVLHVTSRAEAKASARQLPGPATAIIPNCVEIPPLEQGCDNNDGCRLLYLGRLHPKKGLEVLFDALTRLPKRFTLDVYGEGGSDYTAHLRAKAAQCRRITMHGHVENAAKSEAFRNADLFVLPSYSENFGIAIAEALAHGLPVLTTTATPWEDLARQGCGRAIDLDQSDLAEQIAALATEDLPRMGLAGRDWMRKDFSRAAMTVAFERLYHSLHGKSAIAVPA